jgi:hypothetical protein
MSSSLPPTPGTPGAGAAAATAAAEAGAAPGTETFFLGGILFLRHLTPVTLLRPLFSRKMEVLCLSDAI